MFGSEYITLKVVVEKFIGLRYKLRMMGVPIDGTTICLVRINLWWIIMSWIHIEKEKYVPIAC